MSQKLKIYAPEFRQQMVTLHLAGRSLNELAREFGFGASTIAHWVKTAKQSPICFYIRLYKLRSHQFDGVCVFHELWFKR